MDSAASSRARLGRSVSGVMDCITVAVVSRAWRPVLVCALAVAAARWMMKGPKRT